MTTSPSGVVTLPILPSADFDATADFWGRLGFVESGRWPQEYLVLLDRVHAIELHFWFNPDVDRWTNDVGCFVRFDRVADLEACHRDWEGAELPPSTVLNEPKGRAWGAVEFQVIDVHGNLVRLGSFERDGSGPG